MIAEKVFAEGVAKDIRNYLPPEYEDADFQVVQKNKNNGIQLIGVQVNLPERNAIRRSTGIPKIIEKPLVVSLCRVCAGNFYDVPGHYIRRVNPEQRYKDTCMFCNIRKGYDYYIGKKRV